MKKHSNLLKILLISPLFLASCIKNNGLCFCANPVDKDEDGLCDTCGLPIEGACVHIDEDKDGYCDKCGGKLTSDTNPNQGGNESGGGGNQEGQGGNQGGQGGSQGGQGGSQGGQGGSQDDGPKIEVTTYLVLSSVGLYKGNVGNTIPSLNLENTIAFVGLQGSALPGKEEVTHLYGNCDFDCWLCYEGKGAPTVYTVVPKEANKILYASFVDNGKTPITPEPTDDPTIDPISYTKYYLRTDFLDGSGGNWDIPFKQKIFCYVWKGSNNRFYELNWKETNVWEVNIQANTYEKIIFVRANPDTTICSWTSDIYNQTIDLAFEDGKTTAQIENWGAGKCPVRWIS